MKKTIKLAVVAALALGATSAFATNGDHMIGLSAESRALGGTGIAHNMGSANALTNPALLAKLQGKDEFIFAGTIFESDVKVSTNAGAVGGGGVDMTSDEDASVIPAISLAHRINDNLVMGLGMYGTAGMGTDWRGTSRSDITLLGTGPGTSVVDLYNMRSSLMLMQFAPSLAYGNDTFGIGVTAIVQYGSLSIDYDTMSITVGNPADPTTYSETPLHVGSGVSNDIGYGFQIGAYYNPIQSLTIGAVYKSAIDMEYKNQISDAALAYGYGTGGLPAKTDHLEQPEEYGIGVSYELAEFTATMDVKEIKWGDAKGYKDFGWDDQTVYAVGLKYSADSYWLGIGYNYGENPVANSTNTADVDGNPGGNEDGHTMNLFNYAMFPATVEEAYTIGGGYSINETLALDMAYTYTPEVSDTVDTSTVATGSATNTKHKQQALTIAVKFNY
jgi:long-chain fatty acid transport protein